MTIQGREVESAYFVPNLKAWFVESTLCPFIGGDGVQSAKEIESNLIPSINLLLPFAAPKFLGDSTRESYMSFQGSAGNAGRIFQVLESEYQNIFERKLTLKRLPDAVISPRMPNDPTEWRLISIFRVCAHRGLHGETCETGERTEMTKRYISELTQRTERKM